MLNYDGWSPPDEWIPEDERWPPDDFIGPCKVSLVEVRVYDFYWVDDRGLPTESWLRDKLIVANNPYHCVACNRDFPDWQAVRDHFPSIIENRLIQWRRRNTERHRPAA